jgi:hypothetical protein
MRHLSIVVVAALLWGNGANANEPPAEPKAKNVPPHYFDEQLIEHPTPHLPDAVKAKHAGESELVWTAKLCARTDGTISRVKKK